MSKLCEQDVAVLDKLVEQLTDMDCDRWADLDKNSAWEGYGSYLVEQAVVLSRLETEKRSVAGLEKWCKKNAYHLMDDEEHGGCYLKHTGKRCDDLIFVSELLSFVRGRGK